MLDKRDILIRLRMGHSIRKINRDLKVHRTIVRLIYDAAVNRGWLKPDTLMPSDHDIQCLDIGTNPQKVHSLDVHAQYIMQWHAEGVNAVVMLRFLKERGCACKIGAIRRYIRKLCPAIIDPVMVRSTRPGEIMDVDFGYLGNLWDDQRKKFRKAWVFSGRLRHSRKAYRRIVWDQSTNTFLLCHIFAFEHFHGVVEAVCLDNLKSGVIKSSIDNDMLNRSYQELAEHYGFMISPCRVRTPEHKGGVENDIKYIKYNFWPQIREKLKTHPQLTLEEAQKDLDEWDRAVACTRKMRGPGVVGRSPEELFISEEQPALKELPDVRFEPTAWFQCVVRREWWIIHQGSYYTVPYHLIGKTVQVRATTQFMKVFFDHEEVANHPLAKTKGSYCRNPSHAPPFKEEVLNCNRVGLLHKAAELGEHIHQFCERLLSDKCVDKLRAVRSLFALSEKYGTSRLSAACKRALAYGTIRYWSVKIILEKGLDKELVVEQSASQHASPFKHARNPEEYRCVLDPDLALVNE